MMVWSLFIIGLMGLFFYNKIGSIIPMVVLPTTEIIEPKKSGPVPDFLMVKKENEYKNAGSPILWYNIQYYILEEIIHGRPW